MKNNNCSIKNRFAETINKYDSTKNRFILVLAICCIIYLLYFLFIAFANHLVYYDTLLRVSVSITIAAGLVFLKSAVKTLVIYIQGQYEYKGQTVLEFEAATLLSLVLPYVRFLNSII